MSGIMDPEVENRVRAMAQALGIDQTVHPAVAKAASQAAGVAKSMRSVRWRLWGSVAISHIT